MKQVNLRPETLKDPRSFAKQLAEANAFFNDENLPLSLETDNPYADKDGLIEFIVGVEVTLDPIVEKNLMTLKKHLVAMTSIVTAYVNGYAAKNGNNFKTDPELWALALNNLPLMGPSSISTQTYSKKTKGVNIAVDFIELILEIVASEGTSALDGFRKFLKNQGDSLRLGVEESKESYKSIAIGVAVEIFKVGEEIVYVPKIKQFQVNFTKENSEWSAACASYEEVEMNFGYQYAANVFDYESLEDPDIKKAFDKFIADNRKAQIEDASTFFNQDFPTKDAS